MLTHSLPLLELQHFACERDERVLFSSLNAIFYAGQVVQIFGANGSGKTTLLRVLAGVSADYHGRILWRGQALETMKWEFTNDLLYLGHLAGIKKTLTPIENLRWYAAIQNAHATSNLQVQTKTKTVNDEALLAALAEVNLAGYEDTPCHQLSAGQLRRVALARLVFSSATVWVLDEPFMALDKAGIAQLEARLANHALLGGLVLVTSHQDINIANLQHLNLQDFSSESLGENAHG